MASSIKSAGIPVSATSGAGTNPVTPLRPPQGPAAADFAIDMHGRLLELQFALAHHHDDTTDAAMQRVLALRLLAGLVQSSTAAVQALGMSGTEAEYAGGGEA